jgi:hypothetical protein
MVIFFDICRTFFQLLAHMLPSMFIGLFLANMLLRSGYLFYAGMLTRPLSYGANLPESCSAVLTLCLLDKEAAFSMLSELNHRGNLTGKEVVILSILANLPTGIRSILLFVIPISFSMLGVHVGMLFTAAYLGVQLLKAAIGIGAGRLMLIASETETESFEIKRNRSFAGWADLLGKSMADTLPPLKRILKIAIPTLLIAVILMNTGVLTWLSKLAAPLTRLVGLPASSCLVIISGLPSMMVGISTAGPLVTTGTITPLGAIRTLITAAWFHSIYNIIRMSFPINVSLFGPKLGGMVALVAGIIEFSALPVLTFLAIIDA